MKLVYSGVHTDIEIDRPDGTLLTAARGEPFDVSDELGEGLLENPDFAEHKPAVVPPTPKTPAPAVATPAVAVKADATPAAIAAEKE